MAAVVLIAALASLRRLPIPRWRGQPFILAQAPCLFCLNLACFYNAASYLTSGHLDHLFAGDAVEHRERRLFFEDRITGRTLLAAAGGVCSVALLFGRDLLVQFDGGTIKGVGLATLGTLFFSLGNMASRRNSAAGMAR